MLFLLFSTYISNLFFWISLGPQNNVDQQVLFLCHLCLLSQGKVFPSLSLQQLPFLVIRPSSAFLWSEGVTSMFMSLCIHYRVYLCHVLFHLSLVPLLIKQGVLIFLILLHTGVSHAPNQFERSDWQAEKL